MTGVAAESDTHASARRRVPHASQPRFDQEQQLLAQVLDQQLVRSVYQPVVNLVTGAVVAYEALSRGPEGSMLERPDQLFAARRAHALAEQESRARSRRSLVPAMLVSSRR